MKAEHSGAFVRVSDEILKLDDPDRARIGPENETATPISSFAIFCDRVSEIVDKFKKL